MRYTITLTYENGFVNTVSMADYERTIAAAEAIFEGSAKNLQSVTVYDWGENNNRNDVVLRLKRT